MSQKHLLEIHIRTIHTEVDSEQKLMEANKFMKNIKIISEVEVMGVSLSEEEREALELFEKHGEVPNRCLIS